MVPRQAGGDNRGTPSTGALIAKRPAWDVEITRLAECIGCAEMFAQHRPLISRQRRHQRVMRVMGEAEKILFDLFARYQNSPGDLPAEWLPRDGGEAETETERIRRIGNFIAGMTDRFAITEHQRLFDSTPDLR